MRTPLIFVQCSTQGADVPCHAVERLKESGTVRGEWPRAATAGFM